VVLSTPSRVVYKREACSCALCLAAQCRSAMYHHHVDVENNVIYSYKINKFDPYIMLTVNLLMKVRLDPYNVMTVNIN